MGGRCADDIGGIWYYISAVSRTRRPICMQLPYTVELFKEGRSFIAYARELDVSSCGGTQERALKNLKDAVRLFLEEAEKLGTLDQILEEAGYTRGKRKIEGPKFIGTRHASLPLPAHAEH